MLSQLGRQSMVAFASVATVLSTTWSVVSASCSVPASAGLRVNHAQVLATHNSYKLNPMNGIPQFDYGHEPLSDQLDHGVRGFEFDIYLDNNELKVMHVPIFDTLTSCATLPECLNQLAAWSTANPNHFPFHIRLEFIASLVTEVAGTVCDAETLAPATACIKDKCIGITLDSAGALQCASLCSAQVTPLAAVPGCFDLGNCVLQGNFDGQEFSTITEEYINLAQLTCLQEQPTGIRQIAAADMDANQMQTVISLLEAAMDGAFPVEKRITPSDVTFNDESSQYVWPEVEPSRGKVWFYVTGPTSEAAASTFDYFLRDKHNQITQHGNPADVDVSMRQIVRTRVDTVLNFVNTYDTAQQAAAISSGANVLSTDFAVEAPWTTWGGMTQEDAIANKKFFIEGGLPVACNAVTLPAGVTCTSEMLEYLHCTSTSTTMTSTTKVQDQLLLDGDFATTCGTEGTKQSFLAECTAGLTNVDCTDCLPGSLVVVVESSSASDLQNAVMEVETNGLDLPSFDPMIVITTTATTTSITSTTTTEEAEANTAAASQFVGAAFISLLAFVVAQ